LEDTLPKAITTIKIGEGAKGNDIIHPDSQPMTYSKEKGSGVCFYPLTVFCPKCSRTHEYNAKFKEWRQKWLINEDDFSFTVDYSFDDDGERYPLCSKCGFDLRTDFIYGVNNDVKTKEFQEHNFSLSTTKYENGFFVISLNEFKGVVREAYKRRGNLLTSINSSSYKLGWDVYSNPSNIISKDGNVYLRRTLWSQA